MCSKCWLWTQLLGSVFPTVESFCSSIRPLIQMAQKWTPSPYLSDFSTCGTESWGGGRQSGHRTAHNLLSPWSQFLPLRSNSPKTVSRMGRAVRMGQDLWEELGLRAGSLQGTLKWALGNVGNLEHRLLWLLPGGDRWCWWNRRKTGRSKSFALLFTAQSSIRYSKTLRNGEKQQRQDTKDFTDTFLKRDFLAQIPSTVSPYWGLTQGPHVALTGPQTETQHRFNRLPRDTFQRDLIQRLT